jgi:hypothetical protein|tara:strand:+ start:101 stop:295 length:195 start_codon:yes stop_codon:yes gene_type:complete
MDNIERMQMQLDKQDTQINDLFKSVREIKNMNLSNKAMFKGLVIGFGLMVASDMGVVPLLMKLV